MQQGPILSVRVILEREDKKILFLKRSPGKYAENKWSLPGGNIKHNRRAKEELIREVKEETGLQISNVKFIFYRDRLSKTPSEKHYLELHFYAKTNKGVKLNEEHSEFKWINPKEIYKIDTAFKTEEVIKKFISLEQE